MTHLVSRDSHETLGESGFLLNETKQSLEDWTMKVNLLFFVGVLVLGFAFQSSEVLAKKGSTKSKTASQAGNSSSGKKKVVVIGSKGTPSKKLPTPGKTKDSGAQSNSTSSNLSQLGLSDAPSGYLMYKGSKCSQCGGGYSHLSEVDDCIKQCNTQKTKCSAIMIEPSGECSLLADSFKAEPGLMPSKGGALLLKESLIQKVETAQLNPSAVAAIQRLGRRATGTRSDTTAGTASTSGLTKAEAGTSTSAHSRAGGGTESSAPSRAGGSTASSAPSRSAEATDTTAPSRAGGGKATETSSSTNGIFKVFIASVEKSATGKPAGDGVVDVAKAPQGSAAADGVYCLSGEVRSGAKNCQLTSYQFGSKVASDYEIVGTSIFRKGAFENSMFYKSMSVEQFTPQLGDKVEAECKAEVKKQDGKFEKLEHLSYIKNEKGEQVYGFKCHYSKPTCPEGEPESGKCRVLDLSKLSHFSTKWSKGTAYPLQARPIWIDPAYNGVFAFGFVEPESTQIQKCTSPSFQGVSGFFNVNGSSACLLPQSANGSKDVLSRICLSGETESVEQNCRIKQYQFKSKNAASYELDTKNGMIYLKGALEKAVKYVQLELNFASGVAPDEVKVKSECVKSVKTSSDGSGEFEKAVYLGSKAISGAAIQYNYKCEYNVPSCSEGKPLDGKCLVLDLQETAHYKKGWLKQSADFSNRPIWLDVQGDGVFAKGFVKSYTATESVCPSYSSYDSQKPNKYFFSVQGKDTCLYFK